MVPGPSAPRMPVSMEAGAKTRVVEARVPIRPLIDVSWADARCALDPRRHDSRVGRRVCRGVRHNGGATRDRARFPSRDCGTAMGAHRLPADAQLSHSARRRPGRPLLPTWRIRAGSRGVCRCVDRLRVGAEPAAPRGCAGATRRGGRAGRSQQSCAARDHVVRRGTRRGRGTMGRVVGRLNRVRAPGGWLAGRRHVMALGIRVRRALCGGGYGRRRCRARSARVGPRKAARRLRGRNAPDPRPRGHRRRAHDGASSRIHPPRRARGIDRRCGTAPGIRSGRTARDVAARADRDFSRAGVRRRECHHARRVRGPQRAVLPADAATAKRTALQRVAGGRLPATG